MYLSNQLEGTSQSNSGYVQTVETEVACEFGSSCTYGAWYVYCIQSAQHKVVLAWHSKQNGT